MAKRERERASWIERKGARRRIRQLTDALHYWGAEAAWRIERQKWMWRQVRYMQELQAVLDSAGDGQRLAKRLLAVGTDPKKGNVEGQMRAGRAAINRSTAALERALKRDQSPRRAASAERRRYSIETPQSARSAAEDATTVEICCVATPALMFGTLPVCPRR